MNLSGACSRSDLVPRPPPHSLVRHPDTHMHLVPPSHLETCSLPTRSHGPGRCTRQQQPRGGRIGLSLQDCCIQPGPRVNGPPLVSAGVAQWALAHTLALPFLEGWSRGGPVVTWPCWGQLQVCWPQTSVIAWRPRLPSSPLGRTRGSVALPGTMSGPFFARVGKLRLRTHSQSHEPRPQASLGCSVTPPCCRAGPGSACLSGWLWGPIALCFQDRPLSLSCQGFSLLASGIWQDV